MALKGRSYPHSWRARTATTSSRCWIRAPTALARRSRLSSSLYYNHPDIASYQACFGTNIAVTDHQVLGGTLNSSDARMEVRLENLEGRSQQPPPSLRWDGHVYMAPNGPAQISDVIGEMRGR